MIRNGRFGRWLTLPLVLAAAHIVAATPSLHAQTITGSIVGTVRDSSGAALPGVTISLRGERVMGVQTTVSDERGTYILRSISPGICELTFELAGFGTIKRTQIRVEVGSRVEENVMMDVAPLSEQIIVQASSVVVDTQTTSVASTYDKDWIDKAPLQRNSFTDILAAAPGVDPQAGKQLVSFGSMEDQNKYELDGIDLTDTFNGQATTLVRPNTDIFEQAEILSVGAPAEYGNVQGAVFNMVTRQGTNLFHGSAAYYGQPDALTGRNTTPAVDLGFPFKRITYHDFSTQAGGPVVKDRVWFFTAYRRLDDTNAFLIDPASATSSSSNDYFFKPNIQLAHGHMLQGTVSFQKVHGVQGISPDQDPATQLGTADRIAAPGVGYTATLSNTTVLEARYAGFYVDHKRGNKANGGPEFGTYFTNQVTGASSGTIYGWYEYWADRTQVNAKLSHHAEAFLGASHDFKLGLQYSDAPATGLYSINDHVYLNGTQAYGYSYTPYKYGGTVTNWGGFVDDTVQTGRLTLNLGVRYDWSHARAFPEPQYDKFANTTGKTFPGADFYTWNSISPRIGVNVRLTADGRTVLKTHYGRYYAGGSTGSFLEFNAPSLSPVYAGAFDLTTQTFENLVLASTANTHEFDVHQKDPKTDQYVVAVERELPAQLNFSATYLHKRSRDLPVWLDTGGAYVPLTYVDNVGPDASGKSFTVYRLVGPQSDRYFKFTTPDYTRSDANVLSLTATKRMANHWQLTSSAVFTKATGDNIQGLSATLNWRTFGMNPNDFVNSNGLLQRDRFFVFKTQFLYTGLPWGATVGLNYSHSDGYPWMRRVRIPATNLPQPVLAQPRSGDKRFPSIDQLDLRAEKDISFRKTRVRLFVDAFNLTNNAAYQSLRSNIATSSNYGLPGNDAGGGLGLVLPRRAMLSAKFEF